MGVFRTLVVVENIVPSNFLSFSFLCNNFFYFTYKLQFSFPSLLVVPPPSPHPTLHPLLKEGKVSQGEASKFGISSWDRTNSSFLYQGWTMYPSKGNGVHKTSSFTGVNPHPIDSSPTDYPSHRTISNIQRA